jgi:hypothetical protein
MTMAKFFGAIGFAELIEQTPGVWVEDIVEHNYFGDVERNARMLQSTDQVNDNIDISSQISIVADPYANGHIHSMRYVVYMGAKWKIKNVDTTRPPRLILTIGGLYNGQ